MPPKNLEFAIENFSLKDFSAVGGMRVQHFDFGISP